jgi:AcrR family transcriptional regulator
MSGSQVGATLRFAEKREAILDGAALLFNRRGIKAGTLAEVADSVGLATNSLTYYYRKKEDLVCACLARSIAAIAAVITRAARAETLADRIGGFVQGFVGLMADIAERRHAELIFFSDMRALPQPQAGPVFDAYVAMFRQLRRLLRPGTAQPEADANAEANAEANADNRRALNARTHLLLAEVLWSRGWLARYESVDYPRVARAMSDILLHGLAATGQAWPVPRSGLPIAPLPADPPVADPLADPLAAAHPASDPARDADPLRDAYLRTATRLINDHGVGGASVERIAAALALTKGSFYHHHDTKHDLVDDCFERSFALIRGAQLRAQAMPGSGWQRLLGATLPLVQLHDAALAGAQGPLLRLSAWTELPGALRWQKLATLNRLGERCAALVTDGMIDGSLRLVDAAVAAQLVNGLLNALAEIDHWVPAGGRQPLDALVARPLLMGLLASPPSD